MLLNNREGLCFEAKKAKYLPNLFVAILLGIGFFIVGQLLGVGVSIIISLIKIKFTNLSAFVTQLIIMFSLISACVFFWVKFIEKRKISTLGFYRKNAFKNYMRGFFIGLILFSIVTFILFVTGNAILDKNFHGKVGVAAIGSVLLVLPGWIVQSATEEILTRGWLMNVIGAKYNAGLGLIVSSMLFSVAHFLNPNVNSIALINIVLVGLLFGLYVIKYKELWGACGIHASWNWGQGNIYGFEVSGNRVDTGTLFKLKSIGPHWITGGSFGPEAGLVSTLILIIGIFVLLSLIKKEAQKPI
ncbi:MAG: CPBP family intramembrane metalloprotease [Anaeromicrobium sp.]|jgi:membrane protease YdiL (CAAX protease family)|uniref:CPBP family intramembrane glutamic endopeptidase n=1 Tax=Anaeromicrobium sp. TaxID=1929132 RepID=UPI0025E0CFBD|nr:type II CAAX endopeptidase family protein [Anaeromicrobium sp.]MCT4596203.1 CPBP family intramembrane metalloprotease [Anaeromicrobium sp.]